MEMLFEYLPWFKPFWLVSMGLLGACLGSFLNVLIYRLPRGVDMFQPARSFCPSCQTKIPAKHNLPIISWLFLKGKAACCGEPIAVRYVLVEIICAVAFVVFWWVSPLNEASYLCVFFLILLTISWIDGETMLIPVMLTVFGMVMGLVAASFQPQIIGEDSLWGGLKLSAISGVAGAAGLWLVAFLGKLAFGVRKVDFGEAVGWELREPKSEEEELSLVLKGEEEEPLGWSDLFYRKTDRLIIQSESVVINGEKSKVSEVVIDADSVHVGEKSYSIETDLKSVSGAALGMRIPREAMGAGDVWLMGMLGCWIGWQGLLFTLFAASLLALVWALITKLGAGKPMPFGPFLCLAALLYWFWGPALVEWYLGLAVQ